MATNTRDPRALVTPRREPTVAPALLGTPLATPGRRLGALLIDLVVIGVLTAITSSVALVIWGVVATTLIVTAIRGPGRSTPQLASTLFRGATGCLGVVVLLAVLIAFLSMRAVRTPPSFSADTELGGPAAAADDDDDAPTDASALSDAEAADRWFQLRALRDSVDVGESFDPEEFRALTARLAPLIAADTLGALERRVTGLRGELDLTRQRLEAARAEVEAAEAGFFALLRDIWEQAGSAIGLWSLYFTVALTVTDGRTVGKRLLGLRVVRLDGLPITWWSAFERAGGYVAGIATGTLGFLQVFWDPNRQCVHDKIVGTVVVVDGAPVEPGAWQEAWSSTPSRPDESGHPTPADTPDTRRPIRRTDRDGGTGPAQPPPA